MVVEKEEIKKKLLKAFEDDDKKICSICHETIAKYDIEEMNFEYCETQSGENYAHSECLQKMIRK